MSLRHLDEPRLYNRIKLAVKTVTPYVVEATILSGYAKGEDVFIPKYQ
jgi:hypothetical protein